ncbi:MAG: 4Fe-4S binding protein [Clostridiales bacterium]|nr:4Fe-4S binding protein [Clostridiales bacterium]
MDITHFQLDESKCIGCGTCTKVCCGEILSVDERGKARIAPVTEFGWAGCWECQHCLAVCPTEAISIFDRKPEDSLPAPKPETAAPVLDALLTTRRACRRYLQKDVPMEIIEEMFAVLQNLPTGSNKRKVEYTFLDREQTRRFHDLAYARMEELAARGIYPKTFDAHYYGQMKGWEAKVRPDMLLCSAPYLLIPHEQKDVACAYEDVNIACAWWDLLCASRGLGCVMMTFPRSVLELMPDIYALLGIPNDHYVGSLMGFGWPELRYPRGVQRHGCAQLRRPVIPEMM